MRIVHVDLGSKSYDIEIERGLLPHVGVKIKTVTILGFLRGVQNGPRRDFKDVILRQFH